MLLHTYSITINNVDLKWFSSSDFYFIYFTGWSGYSRKTCYSLQNGEWIQQADMKTARWSAAASPYPSGGIMITGGTQEDSGSTEIFSVTTNTWSAGPAIPVSTKFEAHCQVTLGTAVILTG